jgi:hypothetical protein
MTFEDTRQTTPDGQPNSLSYYKDLYGEDLFGGPREAYTYVRRGDRWSAFARGDVHELKRALLYEMGIGKIAKTNEVAIRLDGSTDLERDYRDLSFSNPMMTPQAFLAWYASI